MTKLGFGSSFDIIDHAYPDFITTPGFTGLSGPGAGAGKEGFDKTYTIQTLNPQNIPEPDDSAQSPKNKSSNFNIAGFNGYLVLLFVALIILIFNWGK